MSYKFRSGNTDEIALGTSAVPTTGTISFWTKAPVYGSNFFIFFFLQSGGGNQFAQEWYGAGGWIYSGWYNGTDARVASGVPTDAVWNHILQTWSPASSKTYLNGVQIGSTVVVDGTWNTVGTTRFIGGNGASVSADHYLAEMGIWDAILSGPTIASLYAGQRPSCFPTNAVNYWPLLSDALDSVGGDNGTVSGAVTDADHPTLISCGGGGGVFFGTPMMALRAGQGNL